VSSSVTLRVQYAEVEVLNSSIERDQLSSHARADSESNTNDEITRGKFDTLIFTQLTPLPELPRVEDLRQVYRDFNKTYKRHVEDAKFGVVKGRDFKFLKRRLAFICHLLREHRDITHTKRKELINALLSEDDLRHAQQVINDSEKNKEPGKTSWFPTFASILPWPKVTDEESLHKEMKKIANDITDSDFLLGLKGIEDEDLKVPIQDVVALANAQLSSSVDATVKKLTHAVLRMQQDECKRNIQHEIDTEQRKALGGALVNFIRDVNKNSVGRRTS